MNARLFWLLVGVNAALAGLYLTQLLTPNWAVAQVERPPEYMLLPSEVGGADRGVVYVIDTTNGMLSALSYGDSTGRIEVMRPTDLSRVFEEGVERPRRR